MVILGYTAYLMLGLASAWLPDLYTILVARFIMGCLHSVSSYPSFVHSESRTLRQKYRTLSVLIFCYRASFIIISKFRVILIEVWYYVYVPYITSTFKNIILLLVCISVMVQTSHISFILKEPTTKCTFTSFSKVHDGAFSSTIPTSMNYSNIAAKHVVLSERPCSSDPLCLFFYLSPSFPPNLSLSHVYSFLTLCQ